MCGSGKHNKGERRSKPNEPRLEGKDGLRDLAMPRFFDVREGTRFAPDDEGLEFPDLDAAECEAAEAAAAVRNEHGQRVLTVAVSMRRGAGSPATSRPIEFKLKAYLKRRQGGPVLCPCGPL